MSEALLTANWYLEFRVGILVCHCIVGLELEVIVFELGRKLNISRLAQSFVAIKVVTLF